jgi:Flp pilus assembly protein TadB
LITDAPESPAHEQHSREVRYLIMMGIRALCLIVAAILVSTKPPHYGLWVIGCVIGMVLLPWLAVIIANDRRVKPEHRLSNRFHHTPSPADPRAIEQQEHRVVDQDD